MTTEEKAKAYDEALNWMRELYPGLHGATKEDAEHYFPELRESEDERIRKALIQEFKKKVQKSFEWKDGIPNNAVLDWLEKQKEQKPVDYEHEMLKICVANFEGGKKEVIEHPEKYGLQKPAEWSEEDELMRTVVIQTLETFGGRGTTEMQIAWLKSLRPQPHWKPSKEQMEALKRYSPVHHPDVHLVSLYDDLKKLM